MLLHKEVINGLYVRWQWAHTSLSYFDGGQFQPPPATSPLCLVYLFFLWIPPKWQIWIFLMSCICLMMLSSLFFNCSRIVHHHFQSDSSANMPATNENDCLSIRYQLHKQCHSFATNFIFLVHQCFFRYLLLAKLI